jgi:hypothetical protein
MGGGSSQGSGWTWVDIGAIGQFQKGEEVVQPSPQKQPPPPGPSPEAAQEALPQALAPAEVAHPIPNQEEVAALRRELHGLINPKGGSVVSKGRVKRVQARRNYFL